MSADPRRHLPSVDQLIAALGTREESTGQLAAAAREVLAAARANLPAGGEAPAPSALLEELASLLEKQERPSLRRVINASGVILQTNLGRAPLSRMAVAAMAGASAYSNLEFDLAEGVRGSRHEHVRDLIRRASGAQDGIALNNNAAALFMVLQVFAHGREVIVSRGQAVEIGGGFRIPDVLRQSGARLVEVGTTNRTYARDYEDAVTPDTAAILRVHSSNFKVVGFTAEPSLAELGTLARRHNILLLDDLGSGCLVETEAYGLEHEPTVQESIAAGVDLAMFSGDKLLGGPQAGIIAGRSELVGQLRRHPLARALRLDKVAIAGLNATLQSYLGNRQDDEVPVWQMLRRDVPSIRRRAGRWAAAAGEAGAVIQSQTMVGGGSLPGAGVPTWCAAIRPPGGASEFSAYLRSIQPPVIARIESEAVLLDPRTVETADDAIVTAAITGLLRR